MKKLTAIIIPVVILTLVGSCSQGDKKVMLRYKFEPGLKLSYEQVSKRLTKIAETDSTIKEWSTTFEIKIEQLINRVYPDNTADIIEYSTWKYEMPSKEDTSVIETVEKTRELVLRVQPNGKVLDVEFKKNEDYSNIRYIKNYYEQGMPVFPPHEVSPGYSWTQTTKVILPGEPMEASMTYKVTSLVREAGYDCAVIECNGNMIIPVEANPKDSVQHSGIDRIKTTGLLYFAYREGLVVMQRERWVINRDRKTTRATGTTKYKETAEMDIDYMLKGRTIVDSLVS